MQNEKPVISPTVGDPSREHIQPGEWSPGKRLIRAIRDYQRARERGGPWATLQRKWAVLRHRWWSAISGADVPLTTNLGIGLVLPHPNGVVIHPDVRIGPNCMIFQQVTLGAAHSVGVPVLHGHVDVHAGAKVLGPVTLGADAKVGANAVVLTDVPAGATAVGIPARCIVPNQPQVPRPSKQPTSAQ